MKFSEHDCSNELQRTETDTLLRQKLRKSVYIFLICLISVQTLNAQSKLGNEWITGAGGARVKFTQNGIITNIDNYIYSYFTGGNSCISDTNGNLVLASDGFNVYGNNGQWIEDGDTLVPALYYIAKYGASFNSQTSIILPVQNEKYYFITSSFSDAQHIDCITNNSCYHDLLLYNIIDMNANAGAGKVLQRMVPAMSNARFRKTQMMACRHGNGTDWWLLKNEGDSGNVHTFLFTQDSVYDKGVQAFAQPNWGPWDIRGQSTFNSDGSRFATTSHCSSCGLIFIADFDRCHGLLSNPMVIQMPLGSQHNPNDTTLTDRESVGLAFSPNNQFLYVISYTNVYQYDLQDNTWFHVAGLDTVANAAQGYETAYIGPDSRIYIGNFGGTSKQMSRIDNPDVKGAGCNFCPRCLKLDSLGANAYVGTPPCMPDYGLGAKVCWPLSSQQLAVGSEQLVVYPNPANSKIQIKSKNPKSKKELYNTVGQMMLRTKENEIDVSGLSKGMYYLRVENQVVKVIVE
jgi:hypothetical protein